MRHLRRLIVRMTVVCLGVLWAVGTLAAKDITFVTWNMQWFPSGKANQVLPAEVEMARTAQAARMLVQAVDETEGSMEHVVFCLQEIRDGSTCSNLIAHIDRERLRVAAVSGFRNPYGRLEMQQVAILTTLPVVEARSVPWRGEANLKFGRGFTYAILDIGEGELAAVFCIHLKSNLNRTGDLLETQMNIYKREATSQQILDRLRELRTRFGKRLSKVVVAGDFNTNEDQDMFVSEATLRSFYGAHFRNCFTGLRRKSRVTHPGTGGYPDATFDYILYRGFDDLVARKILPVPGLSDHRPVSITLR